MITNKYARAFLYGCAITLFIIMLGGCAATLPEMYALARACDQENPDASAICQPLWDDWNAAEERRTKREEEGCRPGYVEWVTNFGVTCVTESDARYAIEQRMPR